MSTQFNLNQQNLIPFYIIQDNLKSNFLQIQANIRQQKSLNQQSSIRLQNLQNELIKMNSRYQQKFPIIEKSILSNVKNQLQGLVTIISNQKIQKIVQILRENQLKQNNKQEQLRRKLHDMHKKLTYQITQQNQKYFQKQLIKLKKQLYNQNQTTSKVHNKVNSQVNQTKKFEVKLSNQNENASHASHNASNRQDNRSHGQNQIQRQQLVEINNKLFVFQSFMTKTDKKIYSQLQSLKQNWKQLGTQLLDNKKQLTNKVQQLTLQINKIKNRKDLNKIPQNIDQNYKQILIDKFNDVYQVIGKMINKSQYQISNQRNRNTITRHNQEIAEIRQDLAKNNQFFSIYANSDTENLTQQIKNIKTQLMQHRKYITTIFQDIQTKAKSTTIIVQDIGKNIGELELFNEDLPPKLVKIQDQINGLNQKVNKIQSLNNFDAQKMKGIHDTLDSTYSFTGDPQQILRNNMRIMQIQREQKSQIQRIKQQLFIFSSQRNIIGITQQDISSSIKDQLKKLNKRIDVLKSSTQQSSLSRKPWVCLSCDKQKLQQKVKQSLQKDNSKKKISIEMGKAGGFKNNKSQRSLTNNNLLHEEKFQVYQKFKEKYLTDTLKLPDIYKDKFGQLDTNL